MRVPLGRFSRAISAPTPESRARPARWELRDRGPAGGGLQPQRRGIVRAHRHGHQVRAQGKKRNVALRRAAGHPAKRVVAAPPPSVARRSAGSSNRTGPGNRITCPRERRPPWRCPGPACSRTRSCATKPWYSGSSRPWSPPAVAESRRAAARRNRYRATSASCDRASASSSAAGVRWAGAVPGHAPDGQPHDSGEDRNQQPGAGF